MKKTTLLFFIAIFSCIFLISQQWGYVGSNGFTAGKVLNTSMAIDSNETTCVVFSDYSNSTKTIFKKKKKKKRPG